jgi:GntR family transcriptional regulator
MLGVNLDRADRLPLHDQVCAEVRRAIADGEVRPGERLPPARHLAAVLNVNHNTVLRALRALRDEGLLEFRRGRGITVVGPAHRGAVLARARELVQFAQRNGYGRDELIKIIAELALARRVPSALLASPTMPRSARTRCRHCCCEIWYPLPVARPSQRCVTGTGCAFRAQRRRLRVRVLGQAGASQAGFAVACAFRHSPLGRPRGPPAVKQGLCVRAGRDRGMMTAWLMPSFLRYRHPPGR